MKLQEGCSQGRVAGTPSALKRLRHGASRHGVGFAFGYEARSAFGAFALGSSLRHAESASKALFETPFGALFEPPFIGTL